ncbi:MAG: cache domain-containing protein [Nautiliaceae bacterium]
MKEESEKIIKSIFLFPFFSIVIMWAIVSIIFMVFFNKLQNDLIKDKEETLLNNKKKIEKIMVLSLKRDIENYSKSVEKETKKFIKEKIYEAVGLIERYIKEHKNESKEHIKKDLITILSAIRWENGRGYYFVYDQNTKILDVHPLKSFKGKYVGDFKDIKGNKVLKIYDDIVKKNGEGYAFIYFPTPNNPSKPQKKIVFIKYIKELNWVIGTGEYPKIVENKVKKALLDRILNKRYDKNGYFWVIDSKGNILAHPLLKDKIGKNLINLEAKGIKIVKLFIDTALKHPQGDFAVYYWYKPDGKLDKKIAFLTYFKKWDWIIGSGFYLSNIQPEVLKLKSEISQKIEKLFIIMIVILSIFMIMVITFSFYLSSRLKSLFSEYTENLEEKIKKSVREIRQKDEILLHQSKLAAMGEMLGAIAHQWRQPLNALAINIQMLEDMVEDNKLDKKNVKDFIEKNMKTIQFMSHTIDDFRNFFRKDKEKITFSVKRAIQEVISMMKAQLKDNNIEVEITGEDFEITSYKSEFKQVILNLIINAKDAILSKKIKNGKITIEIKNNMIFIRDNARGIPEGLLNKIFEPYFTTKDNGTGIGLYMSKIIIEKNMGGKLKVRNSNKGAEFIIEF